MNEKGLPVDGFVAVRLADKGGHFTRLDETADEHLFQDFAQGLLVMPFTMGVLTYPEAMATQHLSPRPRRKKSAVITLSITLMAALVEELNWPAPAPQKLRQPALQVQTVW